MATEQETKAMGALQAVLNLYGADAYADILHAFSQAGFRYDAEDARRARALTESFIDIVRKRQAPAIARFAGPFPSQDPND